MSDQTELIKNALSERFDRVLGLFDRISTEEHRNETLCFVGIESYVLKEAVSGTQTIKRPAETVYSVKLLGTRRQSAEELSELFDTVAIPAVDAALGFLKEIRRKPCVYSREQERYCASAEFVTSEETDAISLPAGVGFRIMSTAIPYMNHFTYTRGLMIEQMPMLNGSVIAGISGRAPGKLVVWGEVPYSDISAVSQQLNSYVGQRIMMLSIGGLTLMMFTGISVEIEATPFGAKFTATYMEAVQA